MRKCRVRVPKQPVTLCQEVLGFRVAWVGLASPLVEFQSSMERGERCRSVPHFQQNLADALVVESEIQLCAAIGWVSLDQTMVYSQCAFIVFSSFLRLILFDENIPEIAEVHRRVPQVHGILGFLS